MRLQIILTLFTYLVSLNALAIKGEYIKKEVQSTCRIEAKVPCDKNEAGVCTGTCSATYVGKNKVMTADHCRLMVERSNDSNLICPNGKKVVIQKSKSSSYPKGKYDQSQDIAFLSLGSDPEVPAMEIVHSETEFNRLISHPENCYLAGYGLDNDEKYGKLKVANVKEVESKNVKRTSNGFYYYAVPEQVKLKQNYADHGDSGGSLFCEEEGKQILMGVLQGGTKGQAWSFSEKLVQARDWMEYVLGPYGEKMELFNVYKNQFGFCNAVSSCLNNLKKTSDFSIDTFKVIVKLFEQYNRKSIQSINYSIEGQTQYDEQIKQINANIDQWSALHKMCYGELYK